MKKVLLIVAALGLLGGVIYFLTSKEEKKSSYSDIKVTPEELAALPERPLKLHLDPWPPYYNGPIGVAPKEGVALQAVQEILKEMKRDVDLKTDK